MNSYELLQNKPTNQLHTAKRINNTDNLISNLVEF